jgi:hypothetical protein
MSESRHGKGLNFSFLSSPSYRTPINNLTIGEACVALASLRKILFPGFFSFIGSFQLLFSVMDSDTFHHPKEREDDMAI